jgi:hypothetical protein
VDLALIISLTVWFDRTQGTFQLSHSRRVNEGGQGGWVQETTGDAEVPGLVTGSQAQRDRDRDPREGLLGWRYSLSWRDTASPCSPTESNSGESTSPFLQRPRSGD